ncbi:MAG TPA: response regulator [Terriglobales bacterium]|jgi:two-component system chemotaxis response regulator CheB|nr:response regulator [Terriglobales bacterium]
MAKVLIVDDNPFFRELLCNVFNREPDFEVCGQAENGKEAVEKALRLDPDLVILDLVMPVMNGIDAARVLRLVMPRLPLIMSSALEDQLVEKEARLIGVTEVVPKSAQLLKQTARRVLCCSEQSAAA